MILSVPSTPLVSARLLLVFTIAAALYVTQFPFDFCDASLPVWLKFRTRFDFSLSDLSDWRRNIPMFVPIGIGLADRWRRLPAHRVLFAVIAFSMAFSFFIEFLQTQGSARAGTLGDVISNTTGGALGFLLYRLIQPVMSAIEVAVRKAPGFRFNNHLALAAALLWAAGFLALGVHLSDGRLTTWDSRFPLHVGNEAGGGRPWSGTLSGFTLTTNGALISAYDLRGSGPFADKAGSGPLLEWQGTPAPSDQGAGLGPKGWLGSRADTSAIARHIRQTGQFTLETALHSARADQFGPARVISIAPDLYRTNLTIGQDGDRLSIRLRNNTTGGSGRRPEVAVPGVFAGLAPLRLTVNYQDLRLTVDADGERVAAVAYEPAITAFRLIQPSGEWVLCASSEVILCYELFFYAIVFAPFGMLVPGKLRWPMLVAPLVWEVSLLALTGLPWHVSHVVFGAVMTALGALQRRALNG